MISRPICNRKPVQLADLCTTQKPEGITVAKMTKKIGLSSNKSSLISKSKGNRDAKIEKEDKKKKKTKEASAEKPLKKKKKVEEAPVKNKKKKKVEEVPAKKGKKTAAATKKKAASDKPVRRTAIIDVKPLKVKQTRGQMLDWIIDNADLQGAVGKKTELNERQEKKIVKNVLEAIEHNLMGHLRPGGSGVFSFTNLFKIKSKYVPAKPRRKGMNNFTKQEQWFDAKPATTKVTARPMKRLKDCATQ